MNDSPKLDPKKFPPIKLKKPVKTRSKLLNGVLFPSFKYAKIYMKQKGLCWLCDLPMKIHVRNDTKTGFPVIPSIDSGTFDHVKPKSKRGSSKQENLALAHSFCNNLRKDIPPEHASSVRFKNHCRFHFIKAMARARLKLPEVFLFELDNHKPKTYYTQIPIKPFPRKSGFVPGQNLQTSKNTAAQPETPPNEALKTP